MTPAHPFRAAPAPTLWEALVAGAYDGHYKAAKWTHWHQWNELHQAMPGPSTTQVHDAGSWRRDWCEQLMRASMALAAEEPLPSMGSISSTERSAMSEGTFSYTSSCSTTASPTLHVHPLPPHQCPSIPSPTFKMPCARSSATASNLCSSTLH